MLAVINGAEAAVKVLLSEASTARDTVCWKTGKGRTALHYAADLDLHVVYSMLVMYGADEDVKDIRGRTPRKLMEKEGQVYVYA